MMAKIFTVKKVSCKTVEFWSRVEQIFSPIWLIKREWNELKAFFLFKYASFQSFLTHTELGANLNENLMETF